MEVRIRVSTDTLRDKAGLLTDEVSGIEGQWNDLVDIVRNSLSYWEGNASEKHQAYLEANREDVDTIIRRLKEHPGDLLAMAGIYEETEAGITEYNVALASDVIV